MKRILHTALTALLLSGSPGWCGRPVEMPNDSRLLFTTDPYEETGTRGQRTQPASAPQPSAEQRAEPDETRPAPPAHETPADASGRAPSTASPMTAEASSSATAEEAPPDATPAPLPAFTAEAEAAEAPAAPPAFPRQTETPECSAAGPTDERTAPPTSAPPNAPAKRVAACAAPAPDDTQKGVQQVHEATAPSKAARTKTLAETPETPDAAAPSEIGRGEPTEAAAMAPGDSPAEPVERSDPKTGKTSPSPVTRFWSRVVHYQRTYAASEADPDADTGDSERAFEPSAAEQPSSDPPLDAPSADTEATADAPAIDPEREPELPPRAERSTPEILIAPPGQAEPSAQAPSRTEFRTPWVEAFPFGDENAAGEPEAAAAPASPAPKEKESAAEVLEDVPPEYDPDAPEYRIHTSDTLHISIVNEPDTKRTVPVRPDGRIRYLFDIEVMAAGLTHRQLAGVLNVMLDQYYINPRVTLIGTNFSGNSVFVMGAVKRPGPHQVQNDTRLLDVLATSGVLSLHPLATQTQEGRDRYRLRRIADLDSAYVARKDTILDVDFRKLLIHRDLSQNILLKPRDFIFVPSIFGSEKKIYIVGRVGSPQVYYYTGRLGLMEALLEAGGADTDTGASNTVRTRDTAWARKCYIVRKDAPKPLYVDWAAIQMGKKPDVELKSGDIVYVPERPLSYASRVTTNVIREILAPLKAVLETDDTLKEYYRHDWEFRK